MMFWFRDVKSYLDLKIDFNLFRLYFFQCSLEPRLHDISVFQHILNSPRASTDVKVLWAHIQPVSFFLSLLMSMYQSSRPFSCTGSNTCFHALLWTHLLQPSSHIFSCGSWHQGALKHFTLCCTCIYFTIHLLYLSDTGNINNMASLSLMANVYLGSTCSIAAEMFL